VTGPSLSGPGPAVPLAQLLAAHGLPPPPARVTARGRYVPVVVDGRIACLSAHGPLGPDGVTFTHQGQLGPDLDVEAGRVAARACAIALLASLEAAVGLRHVTRLHRMTGFVWAAATFTEHAAVLDAASEVLHLVLGERGAHARSAVGAASLPFGIPVVLELTAGIDDTAQADRGER
jgi:enamine deaminase RidA (YjgF/YER057c/UK114 family)